MNSLQSERLVTWIVFLTLCVTGVALRGVVPVRTRGLATESPPFVGADLGEEPRSTYEPRQESDQLREDLKAHIEAILARHPRQSDAVVNPNLFGSAIRRLTIRLASAVAERSTLIVWAIDQSGSASQRRRLLTEQIPAIYAELNAARPDGNSLLTGVVGFGDEVQFRTEEPVTEVADVLSAMTGISQDESGKERSFRAVRMIVDRWARFRAKGDQHNVCVVIMTDERGDDFVIAEDVARHCSGRGIVVFCLGSVAPFAAEHGDRFFVSPDGRRFRIRVDRGPESVILESLPVFLPRGIPDERRLISSGFGPYGLCRLCVETGGEFLIVEDEWPHAYEPDVMTRYIPDYRLIREYVADLTGNAAALSLLQAFTKGRYNVAAGFTTRFRADSELALKSTISRYGLNKHPSRLWMVEGVIEFLEAGAGGRETLTEPRWQAGYDLSLARILAIHVRLHTYAAHLQRMQANPLPSEDSRNNTWIVVGDRSLRIDDLSLLKQAETATGLLAKVMDEHAGTPFARLARLELERGFGWSWREEYVEYELPYHPTGNYEFENRWNPKAIRKKRLPRVRVPKL